jgi:tripartite-type tricarboxylate transporter receptor subunit TctC
MIPVLTRILLAACGALSALAFTAASAQTFPANRPIRIIVPLAPGGGSDLTARLIAPGLSERLGQPVVVDNRPGQNSMIGTALLAQAAPDGHTLMVAINTHVAIPWLYKAPGFDAMKDFAPVTMVMRSPLVVTVNSSLPVNNLKEFIAYAKANVGKVNFGSSGTASPPHLAGELFKSMAGIQMTHIPYKGIAPAVTALLGNEIQVTFPNVFVAAPHVKAGRLRALGITTLKRSEAAPDWPTVSEAGLPGYEADIWFGILAPGRTPRPVLERLRNEILAVLERPEIRQQITTQGGDLVANMPEQFRAIMQADHERLGKVIREANIRVE